MDLALLFVSYRYMSTYVIHVCLFVLLSYYESNIAKIFGKKNVFFLYFSDPRDPGYLDQTGIGIDTIFFD